MDRHGESHRPAEPEADSSKLVHLEKEGVSFITDSVSSLTNKLAEAKQALEEEALRRAQLETQLQAAESEKAVREDELAIRRMYEDLTGFTVTEVVMHDASQSSRRYEMVFTGTDYFNLQFSLEESRLSQVQEAHGDAAPARDDFIYIPHVDESRDAGLLASENMPDHFLEQIRFERSAATKFLNALHRSLRK
ncbi:unnamed protein product [Malassezia sympodialis ATCC 42132]|uniref:uncharacterized protein n=1 Tax=Malassezia sympodialis (strain ATCC 42132) TaxID=1230383 RepID=UPI0002C265D3|nr:uncharacterized protein MSY001_1492 [Malassezia sympodialis ATCC 42132]CCU98786.1 unnamed protein product [Malassezia sympodialis ATCC 42132]|eukprot:XP_018740070.1 uncharacterized protein MSY001_1492 [Malassezia sympodialis ATCC 42132]